MKMRTTLKFIPIIAALIILGAGCYGSKATTTTNTTGTGTSVTIDGRAFSPATLTVAMGTTVTWTNNDSLTHTVTGDTTGGPNSTDLATGGTYSFTYATAGTYTYHCTHHPDMTGTIVVTP